MYARVSIGQYQPGKWDEGIQIHRMSINPAAKQQHGFKGVITLLDRTTGKGMTISLWETEADMQAGISSGYYQEQLAKVMPLLIGASQRETYEVVDFVQE
jgi:heme-degrading monooxygenase HmoA